MRKNIMYYKNKYKKKWSKCKYEVGPVSDVKAEAWKLFNSTANAEEIAGYYFVEFGTPIIEHAFKRWKEYIISAQKSNHELSDIDCKAHEILYEFYILYYKSQYCANEDIFAQDISIILEEAEPDEIVGYYLVVYEEKDAYRMWKEDTKNCNKKGWHEKLVDEIFTALAEYKELVPKKNESNSESDTKYAVISYWNERLGKPQIWLYDSESTAKEALNKLWQQSYNQALEDENFDEDNSYLEDGFAIVAWKYDLYRYFEVVKQSKDGILY